MKFVAASVQFHLVSFLSYWQYLIWADRKRKLPRLFLVGQMQCFGEMAILHNEDGKSFFLLHIGSTTYPGGARLSRAVFLCFFVGGLRGQLVRELSTPREAFAGGTTRLAWPLCAVLLLL